MLTGSAEIRSRRRVLGSPPWKSLRVDDTTYFGFASSLSAHSRIAGGRRKIFDEITLESRTGTICLEMVKKFQDAGYVFAEVPVNHYYRSYGKSQFFNWKHLWRTFKQLTALWWKLVVKKEHAAEKQTN